MYDPKTEAHEFIADDRAEAVAKACQFFGVEESNLEVRELPAGAIYGLGGRSAIVAVPPQREGSRTRSNRTGGEAGSNRSEERSGEAGRRPSGGRGGRGEASSRREREPRQRAHRPERDSEVAEAREALPDSKGSAKGEIGPVGDFLIGVVERMGLGPFEIDENTEGDFVVYQLKGPAAEEVGSGDGRAVDALQLLANQMAMVSSEDAPRIVVDAEGNAERREAFLSRIADRAARRAGDTGRAVALDPMNARDRRMIHLALREVDEVATMSIGSGSYRQVVVVPEGSPEFEEARNASEAATRDSG